MYQNISIMLTPDSLLSPLSPVALNNNQPHFEAKTSHIIAGLTSGQALSVKTIGFSP